MVLEDPKTEVCEISPTMKLSTGTTVSRLRNNKRKKLAARWVPHKLTINQKGVRISKQYLDRSKHNPTEFKHRFITVDETKVQHYNPGKQQSK